MPIIAHFLFGSYLPLFIRILFRGVACIYLDCYCCDTTIREWRVGRLRAGRWTAGSLQRRHALSSYLPPSLQMCMFYCFQMIYLIPVASVSTDTPNLILCRLLLDTLSRLYIVPCRVELLSHAQSLGYFLCLLGGIDRPSGQVYPFESCWARGAGLISHCCFLYSILLWVKLTI